MNGQHILYYFHFYPGHTYANMQSNIKTLGRVYTSLLIYSSTSNLARDQMANIHQIIDKAKEFKKNIYLCFIDYAKAFNCVDHNCGKLLRR